jgi:hypothetical protein
MNWKRERGVRPESTLHQAGEININQTAVVALREANFDVYDFRNPTRVSLLHTGAMILENHGFNWREIDIGTPWNPDDVSAETYEKVLENSVVQHGLALDMVGLVQSDVTLLVLPCGNSAHLELGYAIGAGQLTAIWAPENFRAELMLGIAQYMSSSLPKIVRYFQEKLGVEALNAEKQRFTNGH